MSEKRPRRTDPRRLAALFLKEAVQVVRDPSSILIAFILPLILLFLFGFGLSLDVDHLKTGLVVEEPSPTTESLAAAFRASRYLDVVEAHDRRQLDADVVAGRLRGLVVIPAKFAADLKAGRPVRIQTVADGSQPNTAHFVQNYARATLAGWLQQRAAEDGRPAVQPIAAEPRFWFNAELESRFFLIPGSIAVVMTIIGTLLTALVVAREWERGTMEALMATPVGILEILIGKLAPYFVLGMAAMALCVGLGTTLFQVPLRGSIGALTLVSAVFLLPALGQGLLISTIAKNQFLAAEGALISGFMPAFLLSGFIFEIDSMPAIIRAITYVVPARYLVSSLQTIFLAGDIWPLLLPNLGALAALGAVLFGITALKTRKRLD